MRTLLTIAVVVAAMTDVSAECPVTPSPCKALERSAIVFVGEAIAAGPFQQKVGPDRFQFVPQTVRFRVIERFKGIAEEQREVAATVAVEIEGTRFASGLRYIVYATVQSDGQWSTACLRTGMVKERSEDVRQLRLCKTTDPARARPPSGRYLAQAHPSALATSICAFHSRTLAVTSASEKHPETVTALALTSRQLQ